MGIADRLVLDRAQPETLRGVVGRLLQAPVVEEEHLGLAVFEKQLAVVRAFEAVGEVAAGIVAVETGALEEGDWRGGHAALSEEFDGSESAEEKDGNAPHADCEVAGHDLDLAVEASNFAPQIPNFVP